MGDARHDISPELLAHVRACFAEHARVTAASRVDVAVVVPSDATARIQEAHGTIVHVPCALVERALFPEPAGR